MELQPKYRINSIDILRGLIMIIMAIDHTRDFFHLPAMLPGVNPLGPNGTTVYTFFTRWITHFCAPTFVFLSGISAYLSSLKKTKKEAGIFLIKRGLWLVLIELTVVCFGITFNPFFNFIVLQVIWAIGWSMVILGALSLISYRAVFIVGLILVFGHDIFDYLTLPTQGAGRVLTNVFFTAFNSIFPISNTHVVADFYAILPWTGVMLLGYSIGYWFRKEMLPAQRRKLLLLTGSGLIILFIVLRYARAYGDPAPRTDEVGFLPNLFSFLNASKYPPSLQYVCMTLGPSILLLVVFEKMKNKLTDFFSVYGSVPFFYYILHFYLLHIICVIIFYATGHTNSQIIDPNTPFFFRPLFFGFRLPIVYLIWLFVILALYLPCRWFSRYKKTHNQWWLSFV